MVFRTMKSCLDVIDGRKWHYGIGACLFKGLTDVPLLRLGQALELCFHGDWPVLRTHQGSEWLARHTSGPLERTMHPVRSGRVKRLLRAIQESSRALQEVPKSPRQASQMLQRVQTILSESETIF